MLVENSPEPSVLVVVAAELSVLDAGNEEELPPTAYLDVEHVDVVFSRAAQFV